MSQPRIDPTLKIGRFQIRDIYRAFGPHQWFIGNILERDVSLPLAVEGLLSLASAGFVWPIDTLAAFGRISLDASNFTRLIPRPEAETMLRQVLGNADSINLSRWNDIRIDAIYVFGSFLGDKPLLGDLDLAIEVTDLQTSKPLAKPQRGVFPRREFFDQVASRLAGRQLIRSVSIHHIDEIRDCGFSHRLVWTNALGYFSDAPLVAEDPTAPHRAFITDPKFDIARQEQIDRATAKASAINIWPTPLSVDVSSVKPMSEKRYLREIHSPIAQMAFFELIPPSYRDGLDLSAFDNLESRALRLHILPFIARSLIRNRWTLRSNGRLLRSGSR